MMTPKTEIHNIRLGKMLCKVTGHIFANTRPHQLHWGDREMGTAISCTQCSQVTELIQKVSGSFLKAPSLHAAFSCVINAQMCACAHAYRSAGGTRSTNGCTFSSSHRGCGAGPADPVTAGPMFGMRWCHRPFACRQETRILSAQIHASTNFTVRA